MLAKATRLRPEGSTQFCTLGQVRAICAGERRLSGRGASRGRIERLMLRHGIRAIMAGHRRVRTTDSRHNFPIAANLLERNFIAAAPNQVWLTDITYVDTGLALSGHDHGPLQTQDRRLGDGDPRRTATGPSDGHCDTAAWRWPGSPSRSWLNTPRRSIAKCCSPPASELSPNLGDVRAGQAAAVVD
jgi:hypothetical protein